ncbi:hypothetical protein ACFP9V_06650 [Deinococcus radiopugnans]|uniref:hypothetical protein n=1 Tax=Deinococcus radiopugnans TaxID=57497 RepID=UPI0036156961
MFGHLSGVEFLALKQRVDQFAVTVGQGQLGAQGGQQRPGVFQIQAPRAHQIQDAFHFLFHRASFLG